jgi:hypothetical protein
MGYDLIPLSHSIVPTKSIESVFSLYAWTSQSWKNYENRIFLQMNQRIQYYIKEQERIWYETKHKYHGQFKDINEIITCLKKHPEIPRKYRPIFSILPGNLSFSHRFIRKVLESRGNNKEWKKMIRKNIKGKDFSAWLESVHILETKEMNSGRTKKIWCSTDAKKLKVYEVKFKTQIISFMEQKNIEPGIVLFFKELTKLEGVSFDKYIEDWSKELLNSGGKNEALR